MKPIDCPQCGAQLDPSLADPDSRLQCSQCGRRLKLARKRDLRPARDVRLESATSDPRPAPAAPSGSIPPVPKADGSMRRELLLPPPSRQPVPGRATEFEPPVVIDASQFERVLTEDPTPLVTGELRATKSSDEVLREAVRRKALRQRFAAGGLTLLVVACGLAIYLLANPPKLVISSGEATEVATAASDQTASEQQPQANAAETAAVVPASEVEPPQGEIAANEEAAASEVIAPVSWGELRTVGRRDLEKLWAEVHPYVFRLAVRKPNGERKLSGVLIDSRGWVVTSLSAIEGASSIEIWPAPADPLLETAAENLRDEVRGVLAVDRPRDLVLLQINRRLVNVVTALQPTATLLVPGKTLIQAAAVGPERLAWLTEARIARSDASAFPPEIKQAIERRGFDLAPYWPGHQLPLSQGVGAALFTPDGALAGVNTGLSAAGTHYFAEAKWVFELSQQARESAVPLSDLGRVGLTGDQLTAAKAAAGLEPAAVPANSSSSAGDSPFAEGHEAEPVSRQLAEAATACAAFGWLPAESNEHQTALTTGLLAWREARGLIRSRRLFPDDNTKLSKQLAYWTSELKAALLSLDRNLSTEFNRQAWESLGAATAEPRALFVRVALQPGTSPRVGGADTATLELIGLEQFIIATVDAEIAPLLPDSEWLVVVTIDPKEETSVSPAPGQSATARRATGLRDISEVKSIGLKLESPLPADEDGGK